MSHYNRRAERDHMMRYEKLLPHILDLAALDDAALDATALATAKLSFYDWLVVSCAGSAEPLAVIMRDFIASEAGTPTASVTGSAQKFPARAAALANGTISHALDYDDTHFAYVGHPSVAIFPAALAAAEEVGASAADVCKAFLLGAEVSCRIGMVLGRRHYDAGFHQTATAGCFGATVAAARLYQLDSAALCGALGLASTRASGLKSQFGTMGKPFNAGMAAANAIEACGLARRGFTSASDGVGGPQGFVPAHQPQHDDCEILWPQTTPTKFIFADVRHKLHACCHGTHAMIEALRMLMAKQDVTAENLLSLTIKVNPRWLRVCDIKRPRTGLEVKFSYAFLAAMVLHQIDTAATQSYNDALCDDAALAATAGKVTVIGDELISDSGVVVSVEIGSGTICTDAFDLMAPLDIAVLQSRLVAKATALLGADKAGEIWDSMAAIETISAADMARHLRS